MICNVDKLFLFCFNLLNTVLAVHELRWLYEQPTLPVSAYTCLYVYVCLCVYELMRSSPGPSRPPCKWQASVPFLGTAASQPRHIASFPVPQVLTPPITLPYRPPLPLCNPALRPSSSVCVCSTTRRHARTPCRF